MLVANIEARDGGAAIAAGNGRRGAGAARRRQILLGDRPANAARGPARQARSSRLSRKARQPGRAGRRLSLLAGDLAPYVGADPALAARAGLLAKADLGSEMVGEFPELQGLMGRYYALAQGEPQSVAEAIGEHYKPQGPNDRAPSEPVAVSAALADKFDRLAGFWAIDEKPTGSRI